MIIGPLYDSDLGWVRFRQQGDRFLAETAQSLDSAWESSAIETWNVVDDSERKKPFTLFLNKGNLYRMQNEGEEGIKKIYRGVVNKQQFEWQPSNVLSLEETQTHSDTYFALNKLDDELLRLVLTDLPFVELQRIGKLSKRFFHLAHEQIIIQLTGLRLSQFQGYDDRIRVNSDAEYTQLFWKLNFERHFPHYRVKGKVNWQLQFEKILREDYQHLSPKMRRLFSLAKEGDGNAISAQLNTLTPKEIVETDANGFSLAIGSYEMDCKIKLTSFISKFDYFRMQKN